MKKLTLTATLFIAFVIAYPQQNTLVLKKRNKIVQRFFKGSTIAFLDKNEIWQKGEISDIKKDSFFVRVLLISNSFSGIDTFHLFPNSYAINDIMAMPKKEILIDNKNGRFQISRAGGHRHWYWIKSGWIFRSMAAGYTGLTVANGIIHNDFSLAESKKSLLIAGGVFIIGFVLQKLYTPILPVGKKYKVEVLK